MIRERQLSERMRQIVGLVLPGENAADIGTDHGLVPIWLLKHGVCPYVILSDVRKGPLEKARLNLETAGIDPASCELRLGSGLSVLEAGEVSTVIMAGMGGELIAELLESEKEKAASFKRLVLQPRSRAFMLRQWLNDNKYYVNYESLAKEDRRISEVFVAERFAGDTPERFEKELDFIVPPLLAASDDPLLPHFLEVKLAQASLVRNELDKADGEVSGRIAYWNDRIKELEKIRSHI